MPPRPVAGVYGDELRKMGGGVVNKPNAVDALDSLGGGKQMGASGEPCQPPFLRGYKTGAVVREAEQPAAIQAKYGENFYHLHRCDLNRVLSEAVVANDPECGKVGHGLTNLSQDETGEIGRESGRGSVGQLG